MGPDGERGRGQSGVSLRVSFSSDVDPSRPRRETLDSQTLGRVCTCTNVFFRPTFIQHFVSKWEPSLNQLNVCLSCRHGISLQRTRSTRVFLGHRPGGGTERHTGKPTKGRPDLRSRIFP